MKFHDVGDESASSKFAEFDETVEPDVMTRWLIKYFASPAFWTEDVKEKLFVYILSQFKSTRPDHSFLESATYIHENEESAWSETMRSLFKAGGREPALYLLCPLFWNRVVSREITRKHR